MEIGFNAIYAKNISDRNVMTIEIFPQIMIFFVIFALDEEL